MSADSNGDPSGGKSTIRPPKPPVRNFPLRTHALGYWSKKVKGRYVNFGRWGRIQKGKMTLVAPDGNWQEALAKYNAWLESGSSPQGETEALTITRLCTLFYLAKKRKVDAGELSQQSLDEYDATCKMVVGAFGRERLVDSVTPADFAALRAKMAKRWGVVRLGNTIGRVRTIFKYANDNRLIDRPVAFGSEFVKPSKTVMRQHRATGGEMLLTAEEVRALLDGKTVQDEESGTTRQVAGGSPQLRAMVLLGINVGFGNNDVATLPTSALDLAGGWITFARPKNGIPRRAPLWPETVKALQAATKGERLVFSMKCKRRGNAVTRAFGRLLRNLGINGRRRLGFYSLRHTHRTVSDATKDFPAIRLIMGHSSDGQIDGTYVERIDDARLRAVTDHVHAWLFPKAAEFPTNETAKPRRQRKPKAKSSESDGAEPPVRLRIVG